MKYDVIIIGAGVSGLLTAIELAQSGATCCVLERGQVGMESSWAGGGILSPLYPWRYPEAVSALAAWGWKRYPDFFSHLRDQTGIDPQWVDCGHLILDQTDAAELITNWASTYDIEVQPVTQVKLHQLEPAIAERFSQALWLPQIGQVRNPRLLQALHRRAQQLHIDVLEHTAVNGLLLSEQQVSGVQTATQALSAHQVLITTGAWSGVPLNSDILLPPVIPVKGQMIQFQTQPGIIQRITLHEGRYVIPRRDGKVLVGSTLEYTGFDKSTDPQAADALKAAAIALFPVLDNAPVINHWAGLRPGNERQTPFISVHPQVAGLFFNTGHFRNGIILGLASARLCADLMQQRDPILPPADYAFSPEYPPQAVQDKNHPAAS